MTKTTHHIAPARGLRGLAQNWRNDLIAAFSVSLVALPLSLGIAIASGMPPMSGVVAVVIGGLVTTFVRGSHIAINGPAAGLIAVTLAALMDLNDGSGRALHYVLAAFVVSGGVLMLLGVFKLGKLAEIFPSSVIRGILAAIGVIIFGKQIHVALGSKTEATSTISILLDIPNSLAQLNPVVTLISVLSLLLLIYHARISYKLFHVLPAPMWVLVLSVIFVYLFNFLEPHTVSVFGNAYPVGPEFLISLPDNILDGIIYPDFSRAGEVKFWMAVLSITIISSVESLASAKAVDKLDPYKRETNLNKDLMGVGLSTIASGMIGGLPVITVIVRSSVNINNNAKTSWSNFFHGAFILIFILLLSPLIQQVPLAALAAILVFTGYKLASPYVFKNAYEQGLEQLIFLTGTLLITLFTNLLWGLIGGIALTLLVHLLLARLPVRTFFKMIFQSGSQLQQKNEGEFELHIRGVANFLWVMRLKELLEPVPDQANLRVRLAEARLVDLTILEFLEETGRKQRESGGSFEITGLDYHVASTKHPLALKSNTSPFMRPLNPRQKRLAELAAKHGWLYRHEINWDTSYLETFQFFETRPIEYKTNSMRGTYSDTDIHWEIADITFDEGALQATEVYHTTVQVVHLPFEMPAFVLEREGFFDKIFDRVLAFSGQKDIDFELFTDFSKKFLLKARDEKSVRQLFTKDLIRFFENEDIYHIESNGEALLIFKYLRLANANELTNMVAYSERLLQHLQQTETLRS